VVHTEFTLGDEPKQHGRVCHRRYPASYGGTGRICAHRSAHRWDRTVSDVGEIEEPTYVLGNPASCHCAHCSDEGLENLFVRKLRKDGEVRCVAARAAVRACCADNVEVALGTSPVRFSIFRLNPGALPAARSLLPLDVGLSFAVFLDLDHALHLTSRAGAMHSSTRMYTANCGPATKNANRDAEYQSDQRRLMGTPCRFAENGMTSVPV